MKVLTGHTIHLRALEPEDLSFLYHLENDEEVWQVSGTQTPYSRHVLCNYLENAKQDIYEAKQLRLAIATPSDPIVGMIDIYDFDPCHLRCGLGIVIAPAEHRGKGYAKEAVALMMKYCQQHLHLNQVYAAVGQHNTTSQRLFTHLGFDCSGIRKQWNRIGNTFEDELLYQHIYVH